MELVAIYVEKHPDLGENKIINFSYRYRLKLIEIKECCRNSKLCFVLENTVDYNFFDDYINILNVSAIIGANGSGKTSLIKFISSNLIEQKAEGKFFFLFKDNEEDKILIYNKSDIKEILINYKNCEEIKDYTEIDFKKLNSVKTIYYSPIISLRIPRKISDIDLSADYLQEREYEIMKKRHKQKIAKKHLNDEQKRVELRPFIMGKAIVHRFQNYYRLLLFLNNYKEYINNLFNIKISDNILVTYNLTKNKLVQKCFIDKTFIGSLTNIYNEIKEKSLKNKIINKTDAKLIFVVFIILNKILKSKKLCDKFVTNILSKLKYTDLNYNNFTFNINNIVHEILSIFENIWGREFIQITINNIIENSKEVFLRKEELIIKTDIDTLAILSNYQKLFKFLRSYLFFNYYLSSSDDIFSIEWPLSSGEKSVLDFFSRLYDIKKKLEAKSERKYKPTLYLFLDEAETSFHPEWQRKFLKYLIDFILEVFNGYKVQIFIASHSPLLISDLPKNNIIFLKERTKENDELLQIASDEETPETFAANLNNILANGFFLKELIGEFAAAKLKRIDDLLKKENDLDDKEKVELQSLINFIGDKILRRLLLNKYTEKINKDSEPKKEKAIYEILELNSTQIDELLSKINELKSKNKNNVETGDK